LRKTPRELHDLGLKKVARIDQAIQDVTKQAGFTGTLAEFCTFLRTDKRFKFVSADEELITLRDLAKRVDPQLPKLFAVLPRLPYGVRSMPPEEGNNAIATAELAANCRLDKKSDGESGPGNPRPYVR